MFFAWGARSMDIDNKSDITELLMLCRGRDDAAFSELLERYTPMINKLVGAYFDSPYDVSEAFSEASLALHRAAISYDLEQNEVTFGLYAHVCIRNRLLDMLRASRREPDFCDVDIDTLAVNGGIEERLIMRETVSAYREAAERLLSEYEYKIFLCVLKGLKTAEIAKLLGRDAKSVDNAKSRMWRILRQQLGNTEKS